MAGSPSNRHQGVRVQHAFFDDTGIMCPSLYHRLSTQKSNKSTFSICNRAATMMLLSFLWYFPCCSTLCSLFYLECVKVLNSVSSPLKRGQMLSLARSHLIPGGHMFLMVRKRYLVSPHSRKLPRVSWYISDISAK